MATQSLPPIHFFRPGRYQPLSGAPLEFSESDLAAAAAAYDPILSQAPIVVGHPKLDAPAYGWVRAVRREGADLYADTDQVEAQFAELVREGRFKRVSASWYPPHHPKNPKPGVYYLKHIGFLGATPPAVPGLKPVEFADDADCLTVEFAGEYDDRVNASLWRRMREWLIGRFGQDTADQVIPSYQVETLEEAARDEQQAEAAPIPQYAQGDDMSDAEKARLAALEAENARLKAEADALKSQSAEFADREAALAAREAQARQAEIAEFAETLVKAGRVLPRDKAGLVAYLVGADESSAIEFADGDTTIKKPANEWLRNFLAALPVQVDFAERGAPDGDAAQTVAFAAPNGYAVDQAGLEIHAKALAYQREHKCNYEAAVDAVMAG